MRLHLKTAKNYLSNNTGISRIFRYQNRKHAVVMTYHLVRDSAAITATRPICSISREEFDRHIKFFKCCYQIVPLSLIVECIRNRRPFPERCLAITFDDGFRNFFTVAHPVLRKHGVPVTVFLSTNLIGTHDLFWFDKVEQLIVGLDDIRVDIQLGEKKIELCSASKAEVIHQITEHFKRLSSSKRDEAIKRIVRDLGQTVTMSWHADDEYMPMTWEDVDELAKDGNVTFGSHTCSHSIVSGLSNEELYREIFESKRMLEERLGIGIDYFSYPNGQPSDFDIRSKNMLTCAGYKSAATTIEHFNSIDTDCFEIRRFGGSLSLEEIIPRIAGVDTFLVRNFGRILGMKEGSFDGGRY